MWRKPVLYSVWHVWSNIILWCYQKIHSHWSMLAQCSPMLLQCRPIIISYPLFASADTGIYPHAASQYHARPKAKRGIAMLSVDKFPYPRKQTRGNEFIPCSNNICDILKRFRSFKIPAITLIWPKSSYKHSVTRSYRSGKESGPRSESPLWRHQWRSFVFISQADDVMWDTAPYFTVVNQSETRISTEHGIKHDIADITAEIEVEAISEVGPTKDTPYTCP